MWYNGRMKVNPRTASVRLTYVGLRGLADTDFTVPVQPADQFTVAANLAYRWYDEIESGKKKVEYRDMTEYWERRLFRPVKDENGDEGDCPAAFVKFTRGYTKRHMTWTVARIVVDAANGQYCIHLGKRVE